MRASGNNRPPNAASVFAAVATVTALGALGPRQTVAQALSARYDKTFNVASIDSAFVANGEKAIVRLDARRFVVANPGRARLYVSRAVTVLDPDAKDEGVLLIGYDKLRKLKKLQGQVRDGNGSVIRKLKKSDQADYSAISGFSLYEDNRVRVAQLYHDVFPYTVEYDYEVEYDGLINWPSWHPQGGGLPVELGRFEIEVPTGMNVRYRSEGQELDPTIVPSNKVQIYRWEVAVLPAGAAEDNAAEQTEGRAARDEVVVRAAPERFEIEGSVGDLTSWSSFGAWYHGLTLGRDRLPRALKNKVRELTLNAVEPLDRARSVYRYLQETTRYVSVQLGLGGWQPYDVEYVFTNGFGDCKALTNYLAAMLNEVGVEAYPALINTGVGARKVLLDFPSNQFNHVVVMVPMDADTLWLEATDQTAPFGHIGATNEDRWALVIYPGRGELVRTPRRAAGLSMQVRTGTVTVNEAGNAVAEIRTTYSGNQLDIVRGALSKASQRERLEWLRANIDVPVFEIVDADFSGVDAEGSSIALPVRLELARYASRTGSRLFLRTNLMERWVTTPPKEASGSEPIRMPFPFSDRDTLWYALPQGYDVEALPQQVDLETTFARYSTEYLLRDAGLLEYRRTLEFTERVITAERYPAYRDFLRQVAKSDRAKVVLVRRD